MKRSILITALSISIGFPSAIGITETCANKFDQAWAKKVLDIKNWNAKHPEYVKAHNLTRDMSPQTASMKRAMKALEVMCGEVGSISGDGLRDGDVGFVSRSDGGSSFLGFSGDLEGDSEGQLIALVAAVDYPTYDNPSRALPEAPGYPGFGGWYGSAGYIGGGGNSVPPPVVPIAPTPEPSTFALAAIGIAAGIWRQR